MALLGRDHELRVLGELVGRLPGHGGALLVLGEPGIGKSSLLRDVVSHAAGLVVLETVGVPTEEHLPFAGLHDLLRPVLSAADVLPATQRRALSAAFGAGDGPPPEPFMIALAVLNLLAEVASRRPLLVVIDDVQWLDQPTRDVLAFVARRVGGDPIVIIAAARTGYLGPATVGGDCAGPALVVGRPARRSAYKASAERPGAGSATLITSATGLVPSRRATNASTSVVASSSHWASSTTTSNGSPVRRPSTAKPARKRFGAGAVTSPKAARKASR
jgi:hypothetical protein